MRHSLTLIGVMALSLVGCVGGTGGGVGAASWSGSGYDVPVLEIDKRLVGKWRDERNDAVYDIAANGLIKPTDSKGKSEWPIRPLVIHPGRLEYNYDFGGTIKKRRMILVVEPDKVIMTERDKDEGSGAWEPVTILTRVE